LLLLLLPVLAWRCSCTGSLNTRGGVWVEFLSEKALPALFAEDRIPLENCLSGVSEGDAGEIMRSDLGFL
jgi:hypothetical protein